jgi:very-short-patch-repair endonuclease
MAPDDRIAAIAAGQFGVFSRRQAFACDFTKAQIAHRIATGRWIVLEPGVYAIAGVPIGFEARVMGALLATGDVAAASRRSAAALHGVLERPAGKIDVIVPGTHHAGTHATRVVHRANDLGPRDVQRIGPIRVTRPPRTLIDLAGLRCEISDEMLASALDTAVCDGLTTIAVIRRYIDDRNLWHSPGMGRFKDLLNDREGGIPASELERIFIRIVDRFGLLRPDRQRVAGKYRIDFVYELPRVMIEVDGFKGHRSKRAFQRDRERQNRLVLEGWMPLRFTWADVTSRPDEVVAIVQEALQIRIGTAIRA